jgi:hypothetical protein
MVWLHQLTQGISPRAEPWSLSSLAYGLGSFSNQPRILILLELHRVIYSGAGWRTSIWL